MTNLDLADPKGTQLKTPYLKLYSVGTPNGQKITILLQLLNLAYSYRKIDLGSNEQKEDWFIKLNPNGRIPTLSDVDAEGKQTVIFETGAILQYLGEKYDKDQKYYYKISSKYYWDQVQWLTFQVASHAPYQGQAAHFVIFAKEKVPYGIKRYVDETRRIFGVYEIRLKQNNGWLVGDHLNIADIAAFPWIRKAELIDIDLAKEFPELKKWVDKIEKIDGVAQGLSVA